MRKYRIPAMVLLIIFAAAFVCGCTGQTGTATAQSEEQKSLMVYCGAGMREPMEDIAAAFESQTGVAINFNYGGSNTVLSQMELTRIGDVYMPGASSYFDAAREKGFVEDEQRVVYHVPLIIVPKGNPANITCLADLAKPGVRVALGDEEACAIGKLCIKLLEKNGIKDAVYANTITRAATVNELVVYTAMGTVDASVVWEDLYDPEKLDRIEIPVKQNVIHIVPIGSLTFSKQKDIADDFVGFVASDDGRTIFIRHGFTTYPDPHYETS
jgi:molybdate transport system substrate-binding protein